MIVLLVLLGSPGTAALRLPRPRGAWSAFVRIDLASLRLADGREVSARHAWGRKIQADASLREPRDGACRTFTAVLGPDRDAAHANHFHLDLGRWTACQ